MKRGIAATTRFSADEAKFRKPPPTADASTSMSLAELQDQRSRAFSTLQMIEYFTGDGQAENKECGQIFELPAMRCVGRKKSYI